MSAPCAARWPSLRVASLSLHTEESSATYCSPAYRPTFVSQLAALFKPPERALSAEFCQLGVSSPLCSVGETFLPLYVTQRDPRCSAHVSLHHSYLLTTVLVQTEVETSCWLKAQRTHHHDCVPTYSAEPEETLCVYVTSCSLRGGDKMSAGLNSSEHILYCVCSRFCAETPS